MADIFNEVLLRNYTPEGWRRTRIKVLLKKGDARILDNYRPISILPILYKLFTRVLTQRVKKVLDAGQSADQAGFRPGYSTDDHLFVTTMLFERAAEWGAPIWIAAVDFKKAFDSVSHDELFAAMLEMGVEAAYVNVLKRLYAGQTANVVTDKISKDFEIKRGTKQGDPISPILFNAVLEAVMRKLKQQWVAKAHGVRVGIGQPRNLQNLRFAHDILLVGKSLPQVHKM